MAAQYELKKTTDLQFMFNLKSANGEVILTSERYTSKQSAEAGIESCKTNAGSASDYEKRIAQDKRPYFVLKAANHQIIGSSQEYSSDAARDGGIAACISDGPGALTHDLA